jgi:hypothetical protein
MMVVRVEADRIEVRLRGLAREPFGHGCTAIERGTLGTWRFVPDY